MTHTLPQNLTNSKPLEPKRAVLLSAAQYIREHGWCQHTLEDSDGSVCAVGAVFDSFDVRDDGVLLADMIDTADAAIALLTTYLGCLPQRWNDDPNRTKEEVIAGLTSAAFHNLDVTP